MMLTIIDTLSILLLVILLFPAFTVLLHLIINSAGKKKDKKAEEHHDFAVIITAYKNFSVTLTSIESLIRQNYPKDKYSVYVVADNCSDVTPVSSEIVSVLSPKEPLNSKVKSILHAIDRFTRRHDFIIVMDADNVAAADYLDQMNRFTQEGFSAVQGRRTHKNLDTVYAGLDAAGEIYYNYTQRTVPYEIGSSAAIAGSAMAIRTDIYEGLLRKLNSNDGVILAEDKMLQNFLAESDITIAFAEDAVVFDEKISQGDQTQRQRTRWLKSYFDNLRTALAIASKGLGSGSFNQLFFGLMTAYPPIIVMILGSLLLAVISAVTGSGGYILIAAGWGGFILNFIFVLMMNHAKPQIWKSLFSIPLFAFRQVMALLHLKKSKTDFLATEHTKQMSLDEIYKENKK